MSLEGSLQTVALPEVLHLLADTSKSGELRISGSRAEGRLWFTGGELSGFQSGRSEQAADALFDLLRMEDGAFVFEAGVDRSEDALRPRSAHDQEVESADIRPVLEQAEARLVEWGEIVAVVPSLAHRVELAPVAPEGGVVLDAPQWSLVVAIGEGRPVQDVLDRVQLPEFAGCKALKELVEGGVVDVPAAGSEERHPDEGEPGDLSRPDPDDVTERAGDALPSDLDPGSATLETVAGDGGQAEATPVAPPRLLPL